MQDGKDFILEDEIRRLQVFEDSINVYNNRISETVKPIYPYSYARQNSSNDNYVQDFSLLANMFNKNIKQSYAGYQNVTLFNYKVDKLSILTHKIDISVIVSDYLNMLYKPSVSIYHIDVNTDLNSKIIDILKRYDQKYLLPTFYMNQTFGL